MQDITQQNFEAELVNASLTQPVLLDLWAPWCGPCKTLGPILEKLETDYAGRFKLTKLNADLEPEIAQQLSQMFGVRSIPFCVLFSGGQPVDGFVGALPEAEVRKFLDKHVPSAGEAAALENTHEAEALLADGDVVSALDKLQAAVSADPANDTARYEYLRALLDSGQTDEAVSVYAPVARQPLLDARLVAIGHWLEAIGVAVSARSADDLAAALATDKRDFGSRFELAQIHLARGDFAAAMDELLEILMRDKTWRDDSARKLYVAALQLLQPHGVEGARNANSSVAAEPRVIATAAGTTPERSVVDGYRRKLSMILF